MTHQDFIFYAFLLSGIGIGGLVIWSFIRAHLSKSALKHAEHHYQETLK